jgi:transcription elongation factor GreA
MTKSIMTTQGEQKLREELHNLKTKERPEVIQAIAEARALVT